MKHVNEFREGDNIRDIYLCRSCQSAVTKNGKEYLRLSVMDRTGVIEGLIWDPTDGGIEEFDKNDYILVIGTVRSFNNALQLNVNRVRRAGEGEYDPAEYLPMSRFSIDDMYRELLGIVESIKDEHLRGLCTSIFVEDKDFVKSFRRSSAAKSVHHNFAGGLLEHTLSVTKMCIYLAGAYDYLNRDLLITAAMCHDIGKVKEFTDFPENDYSDDGQLLGHIVMGYEMVGEYAAGIEDFPPVLLSELRHCILSHHGELEFGSPKKPALAEAIALSFADNTDAKLETMRSALEDAPYGFTGWLGFNRYLDSNIRKTV